jgi:hypothetical protein
LPLLLQRFPRGHRHWQQPLVGQFLRELGYQVLFVKEQSFLRLLLRLPPTELAILWPIPLLLQLSGCVLHSHQLLDFLKPLFPLISSFQQRLL